MSIEGRCQCGALTYRATEILATARCHCTDCQAQSAGAFGLSVYVPEHGFELRGEAREFHSAAESGRNVMRLFCPVCGSRVAHMSALPSQTAYVSLKGGSIDGGAPEPSAEIWASSRLPWIELLPDRPVYDRQPPSIDVLQDAYRNFRTRNVYDAQADAYATLIARDTPDADLEAFMARLPDGGHVLDLGCGPGNSAAMMAARGFCVEATDFSAQMVTRAAAQPGVTAWQADFEALNAQSRYHGVWANFSLLHAPKRRLPEYLTRIHDALIAGGVFHIGMKLGSGEQLDRLGRFYSYYGVQELKSLLQEAGFGTFDIREGSAKSLAGDMETFVIVLCHA